MHAIAKGGAKLRELALSHLHEVAVAPALADLLHLDVRRDRPGHLLDLAHLPEVAHRDTQPFELLGEDPLHAVVPAEAVDGLNKEGSLVLRGDRESAQKEIRKWPRLSAPCEVVAIDVVSRNVNVLSLGMGIDAQELS